MADPFRKQLHAEMLRVAEGRVSQAANEVSRIEGILTRCYETLGSAKQYKAAVEKLIEADLIQNGEVD